MRNLWFVSSCLLLLLLLLVALAVGAEETRVAPNGTGLFGHVSTGNYTLGDYLDKYEEQEGPWLLGPYIEIATNFVYTVIKVPWDLIVRLKDSNFDLNEIMNQWQDYAKLEAPMLVPTAIGLVLSIIIPFVGIILAFCRCCGRCGGRYTHEEARAMKNGYWGFWIGVAIMICCIVIIAGVGAMIRSSHRLNDTLPHFQIAADHAVDDFILFEEKLFEELDLVAVDQFKAVEDIISSDLDHLPDLVGGPFMDVGWPDVQNITASLQSIDEDLDSVKDRITQVNSVSAQVSTIGKSIADLVNEIKTNLTSLQTTCAGQGSSDCSHMISSDDVTPVFDFSKTPDMKKKTTGLDPIRTLDLKSISDRANDKFKKIPKDINGTTFSKAQEVKDKISGSGLSGQIETALNARVKPLIRRLFAELNVNATKLKHDIRSSVEVCATMTGYQWRITIVILSIPVLTMLLSIFGVIIGGLAVKCTVKTPRYRNKVSHVGAQLNWSSSTLIFFGIFWFFCLGAIAFLIGAHLTFACKPIKDKTVFPEFLDKPEYWNDSYILAELLYQNGSIPLKLGDVMSACAANRGIYGALQLNNSFTVYDHVNVTGKLPRSPDLGGVFSSASNTVKSVVLMEDASRQKFADVLMSPPTMDPLLLMKDINDGFMNLNLIKTIADLENAADHMTNPTFKSAYIGMALRLKDINAGSVQALKIAVTTLNDRVHSISKTTDRILATSEILLQKVEAMKEFLQNEGPGIMMDSIKNYFARLVGHGEKYLDYVQDSLFNSVGQCKVMDDIYRVLSESVCERFVGGLNGYWLSLNVIAIFLVILNVLNFKISNYYRLISNPPPPPVWDLTPGFHVPTPPQTPPIPPDSYRSRDGSPSLRMSEISQFDEFTQIAISKGLVTASDVKKYWNEKLKVKNQVDISNNASAEGSEMNIPGTSPAPRSIFATIASWFTLCTCSRISCSKKSRQKNNLATSDVNVFDVESQECNVGTWQKQSQECNVGTWRKHYIPCMENGTWQKHYVQCIDVPPAIYFVEHEVATKTELSDNGNAGNTENDDQEISQADIFASTSSLSVVSSLV